MVGTNQVAHQLPVGRFGDDDRRRGGEAKLAAKLAERFAQRRLLHVRRQADHVDARQLPPHLIQTAEQLGVGEHLITLGPQGPGHQVAGGFVGVNH